MQKFYTRTFWGDHIDEEIDEWLNSFFDMAVAKDKGIAYAGGAQVEGYVSKNGQVIITVSRFEEIK